MATLLTNQVDVGITRVLLHSADGDGAVVHVHNDESGASADIFLGDDTVTATTGLKLNAGADEIVVNLRGNDDLYAITAAGTVRTSYMVSDY